MKHDKQNIDNLLKVMSDRAGVLNIAAAWGSDSDAFLMEKAIEVIEFQQHMLGKWVELAERTRTDHWLSLDANTQVNFDQAITDTKAVIEHAKETT